MQIREALISQSPSLALQRAAADEIARLDAEVARLREHIYDETDRVADDLQGMLFQGADHG